MAETRLDLEANAPSPAPETAQDPELDAILVPPGNPLRPRSALIALAGLFVTFLVVAADRRFGFSVPVGAAGVALASFGLLDALGTFDGADEPVARRSLGRLWKELVAFAGSGVLWIVAIRLSVAGVLRPPIAASALLVTTTSLALLVTGFRLIRALGALGAPGEERPLLRRHGFWLLALNAVLYLPMLGNFSLIDPWEPHYGEVAREMLARNDWISFWWAQENWFFSKPALSFWLQGLSFSLFGVEWRPDRMIASVAEGRFPEPEWAARMPIVLLAFVAVYLCYRAVARVAGRRAGFLGGLVLTTMPYWFFLAHQSMTDMPYVAPLTAALALVLLGLNSDPERRAAVYELAVGRRRFGLSAAHALLGLVLCTSLPQLLYLLSRNLTLVLGAPSRGFALHADAFFSGSGEGNCGLPGNEACQGGIPVNTVFQPAVGALIWAIALGLFLFVNRGERRVQRLCFLGAWYCVALALLAKGAPGLVLPVVVAVAAVCAARRFRDLARLELTGLALLIACVALPWYVQAFMRHGTPFTDRLLFHDMYKRAFEHVHDTNAGDDVSFRYYVWQLGYGLFPWTGLCAAGLALAFDADEARSPRAELGAFLGLWFVFAFALFSVSLTKFHHYVLPAVPPAAMLTGIFLDRLLGAETAARAPGSTPTARFDSALLGLLGLLGAALVVLVGRDLWSSDSGVAGPLRLLHLFTYNYDRPWPNTLVFEPHIQAFTVAFATVAALAFVPRLRRHAVALALGVGCLWCAFCLNVYLVQAAPHWGQRETVLAYYATRAGPEEPLVAYQMNWKGENFYTGNRIPAFVSSGSKFRDYVSLARKKGVRVMYFTTEHSRQSVLKNELGPVKSFVVLTGKDLNNKFLLARVEL